MVTEIRSDNSVLNDTRKSAAVEPVHHVQAVRQSQELPGEPTHRGKALPPDDAEAVTAAQDKLENAVGEFNDHAQQINRELRFTIDKDSGHTVIKVMDTATQELIRQIPSEEALRFARKLSEGEKLEIFNSFT